MISLHLLRRILVRRPEVEARGVARGSARTARRAGGRARSACSSCAFAAAGISRSDWNGPPGAARIRKKVSVAIAHSVGIMSSSRRRTNAIRGGPPAAAATTSRPPVVIDPHVGQRVDVEHRRVDAAHVRLDQRRLACSGRSGSPAPRRAGCASASRQHGEPLRRVRLERRAAHERVVARVATSPCGCCRRRSATCRGTCSGPGSRRSTSAARRRSCLLVVAAGSSPTPGSTASTGMWSSRFHIACMRLGDAAVVLAGVEQDRRTSGSPCRPGSRPSPGTRAPSRGRRSDGAAAL